MLIIVILGAGCIIRWVQVTMYQTPAGGYGMEALEVVLDKNGNQVVVLPDIIFSNKQNID